MRRRRRSAADAAAAAAADAVEVDIRFVLIQIHTVQQPVDLVSCHRTVDAVVVHPAGRQGIREICPVTESSGFRACKVLDGCGIRAVGFLERKPCGPAAQRRAGQEIPVDQVGLIEVGVRRIGRVLVMSVTRIVQQTRYLEQVAHDAQVIRFALRFAIDEPGSGIPCRRNTAVIELQVVTQFVQTRADDRPGRRFRENGLAIHDLGFVPQAERDQDLASRHLRDA